MIAFETLVLLVPKHLLSFKNWVVALRSLLKIPTKRLCYIIAVLRFNAICIRDRLPVQVNIN